MADDQDCLFCRLIAGDEEAEFVAREDHLVVFHDKFPRAPVHVLVVPTEHLASAHELTSDHRDLLFDCFRLARQVAEDAGIAEGYRIVTNIGRGGGQAIDHLHLHVLGGKQLGHIDGG